MSSCHILVLALLPVLAFVLSRISSSSSIRQDLSLLSFVLRIRLLLIHVVLSLAFSPLCLFSVSLFLSLSLSFSLPSETTLLIPTLLVSHKKCTLPHPYSILPYECFISSDFFHLQTHATFDLHRISFLGVACKGRPFLPCLPPSLRPSLPPFIPALLQQSHPPPPPCKSTNRSPNPSQRTTFELFIFFGPGTQPDPPSRK